MKGERIENQQGHWVLAKMGKKVLRPGGKELTLQMLQGLNISEQDDVVEFAPGLGFTAKITISKNPKSYTAIELNEDAAMYLRKNVIKGENRSVIIGNASATTLENEVADKVYGEAMLTMQTEKNKAKIIKEAYRILKPGGWYAIHEIVLEPESISKEDKDIIRRELARVIKVNARPLTEVEWTELLENEGFTDIKILKKPMHLLEPKRMLDDEGIFRTLKIIFNVLTTPQARKRIFAMRKVFRKYEKNLDAIAIIAKKN
ncbi:MAG: class I SAM-dependent methyltransferase [Weeksellaceae bacterium]